jgi:hypothetical protein
MSVEDKKKRNEKEIWKREIEIKDEDEKGKYQKGRNEM